MSLSELSTNLNHVRSLADKPAVHGDELKAVFDMAGNEIKEYINQTLTKEIDALVSNINTQIQTDENRLTQVQLNKIYPVGSLYMSMNNTNPTTLFGGIWEQIKDRFILGAGDTYDANSTGGEATHLLTESEMPSHTHTFTGIAHKHSISLNTGYAGEGSFKLNTAATADTVNMVGNTTGTVGRNADGEGYINIADRVSKSNLYNTVNINNHRHSISGNTANATATGTISNTGGGQAHNNMPPYLTVYIWKRTA